MTSTATLSRPVTAEPRHEHGRACYWDLFECRWVCSPPARTVASDRR